MRSVGAGALPSQHSDCPIEDSERTRGRRHSRVLWVVALFSLYIVTQLLIASFDCATAVHSYRTISARAGKPSEAAPGGVHFGLCSRREQLSTNASSPVCRPGNFNFHSPPRPPASAGSSGRRVSVLSDLRLFVVSSCGRPCLLSPRIHCFMCSGRYCEKMPWPLVVLPPAMVVGWFGVREARAERPLPPFRPGTHDGGSSRSPHKTPSCGAESQSTNSEFEIKPDKTKRERG